MHERVAPVSIIMGTIFRSICTLIIGSCSGPFVIITCWPTLLWFSGHLDNSRVLLADIGSEPEEVEPTRVWESVLVYGVPETRVSFESQFIVDNKKYTNNYQ